MHFEDLKFRELVDAVASKTPTPGGGAVASIVAALGAALAQMVLNFSIGKKSLAQHEDNHREALRSLQEFGTRAMELAEADAKAYGRLNELWKLDKNDARRARELPAAVDAAIEAPHAVLHVAMEMLRLLAQLCGTTSPMLNSDLAMAAILAEAAARAAACNIRINLPLLGDEDVRQQFQLTLAQTLASARKLCEQIEHSCAG